MLAQKTASIRTFRRKLHALFPKLADTIMNLLDALSSCGHQYDSVVKLSMAECFKRQYSSVTAAITKGLSDADWEAILKLVYQTAVLHETGDSPAHGPNVFILDATPQPRPCEDVRRPHVYPLSEPHTRQ